MAAFLIRYLIQSSGPNEMTVIEDWANEPALLRTVIPVGDQGMTEREIDKLKMLVLCEQEDRLEAIFSAQS